MNRKSTVLACPQRGTSVTPGESVLGVRIGSAPIRHREETRCTTCEPLSKTRRRHHVIGESRGRSGTERATGVEPRSTPSLEKETVFLYVGVKG